MRFAHFAAAAFCVSSLGCGGGAGSNGGSSDASNDANDAGGDALPAGATQLTSTNVMVMTMDADTIYFVASDDGTTTSLKIRSVPKAGGTTTTLFDGFKGGVNAFVAIAVDGSNVYWSDGASTLTSVPIHGGAPDVSSGLDKVCGVAVDDGAIYWSTCGSSGGTITRSPKPGGSTVQLVTGASTPRFLRPSPSEIVYAGNDASGNAGIYAVDKVAGGTPRTISKAVDPDDLVLDGTDAWWADFGLGAGDCAGNIESVPIAGGTATVGPALCRPLSVALDANNVYAVLFGPSSSAGIDTTSVIEYPRTGGATKTIADKLLRAVAVLVDDTSIYWGSGDGIFRIAK